MWIYREMKFQMACMMNLCNVLIWDLELLKLYDGFDIFFSTTFNKFLLHLFHTHDNHSLNYLNFKGLWNMSTNDEYIENWSIYWFHNILSHISLHIFVTHFRLKFHMWITLGTDKKVATHGEKHNIWYVYNTHYPEIV